jgi:hypothetical protein
VGSDSGASVGRTRFQGRGSQGPGSRAGQAGHPSQGRLVGYSAWTRCIAKARKRAKGRAYDQCMVSMYAQLLRA